jgi:hypothetical protein
MTIDGVIIVTAPRPGDRPVVSAADALIRLENSSVNGDPTLTPMPAFRLARLTVSGGPGLVHPWSDRLGWIVDVPTRAEDLSLCPMPPATSDPAPPVPQHHVYAIDASGVGDGFLYVGPELDCGRQTPGATSPLSRLWSAPWRVSSTGRSDVVLSYQPPPCGTVYLRGAVSIDPYEIAFLYEVPYAAHDCPATVAETMDIPGNYLLATPAPPDVHPPLFGFVRELDNGLQPDLPG